MLGVHTTPAEAAHWLESSPRVERRLATAGRVLADGGAVEAVGDSPAPSP